MNMNSEELKQIIKNILSVVEEVPESYKEKCFEILLSTHLKKRIAPETPEVPIEVKEQLPTPPIKFVVPIDVRAFFQQQSIPEEKLSNLFFMEGNEVRPIYKIDTIKKATAQIQLALLTSLENALRGGKFEFSVDSVRQRCIEHRCYDSANFKTHFKNNLKFFKNLSDEEHVELSPDGKAELAEVISEIAK